MVPTDLQCWAIESLFLPEFTDWKPSDALYSHTSVLELSKWAITGEYCTASQSDSKEKSNIVNIDIDNPVRGAGGQISDCYCYNVGGNG